MRFLFLGWNSANEYISRLSKPFIIPILRIYGAKIGKNCDIESGIRFHNCRDYRNFRVGDVCHIGKDCFFDLRGKISFAENVVISMKCTFITHIDMSKSKLDAKFPNKVQPIVISRNTYVGCDSTILMGVSIGEDVIIGAKSLVIKDAVDNAVIAGVPAKLIKSI